MVMERSRHGQGSYGAHGRAMEEDRAVVAKVQTVAQGRPADDRNHARYNTVAFLMYGCGGDVVYYDRVLPRSV